ncbi:RNA-binding protein [Pseudolabrys taiwanensis]|uniref:RNA-binding protein n=1 Tax=Pseudolabrys taiwanensis TaxID=331696 RepID=A0A345ZZ41_9HYPH|nr:RNA-binding protein [Pseudolabrys taiwanensis]AXK82188.1 RNA-binding protein [Pseudolabrys taiwanensis]
MLATEPRVTTQEDELDRGATTVAPGTQRTCALTRKEQPVSEMIRFVVGPGDTVVADVKRKLPGRGLWITATRKSLTEAVKRNVFARGFKRNVKVATDLPAQTEAMLERAALDALAVAGKAGLAIAGFAKVEAALARNEAVALLHASDGAADGKRKLDGALRRIREETDGIAREIALVGEFSGVQLDLALNRPNVVHAALLAGPGSETFLARVSRLVRYRTGQSPEAVSAHAPTDGA